MFGVVVLWRMLWWPTRVPLEGSASEWGDIMPNDLLAVQFRLGEFPDENDWD